MRPRRPAAPDSSAPRRLRFSSEHAPHFSLSADNIPKRRSERVLPPPPLDRRTPIPRLRFFTPPRRGDRKKARLPGRPFFSKDTEHLPAVFLFPQPHNAFSWRR